jgi:hypothetical protein
MQEVTEDGETYILVNGTVRNVAGRLIEILIINVHFYDVDDNELFYRSDIIAELPNTYTGTFSVDYGQYAQYYDKIDHVTFSFKETVIPGVK